MGDARWCLVVIGDDRSCWVVLGDDDQGFKGGEMSRRPSVLHVTNRQTGNASETVKLTGSLLLLGK